MRAWQRLRHLRVRGGSEARRIASALGPTGRALAERLAYRPREVVVVALLCGGLFGGLLVERWRARHPATADRLEAEPPRLTSVAAAPPVPRPRPRAAAPRCDPWGSRRTTETGLAGAGRPRLDLNHATPRQLARLAGISWGLAARIVVAREAFEGRNAAGGLEPPWPERHPGYRRRAPARPVGEAEPEASGATAPTSLGTASAPDPAEPVSGEDSPDPGPE